MCITSALIRDVAVLKSCIYKQRGQLGRFRLQLSGFIFNAAFVVTFFPHIERRHAAAMPRPRAGRHEYSHTVPAFADGGRKKSPRVKCSVDENIRHAAVSTLHSAHTRSGPSNLTASVSGNAELHIFAIQHENGFSSSISYKCCFVLIFH